MKRIYFSLPLFFVCFFAQGQGFIHFPDSTYWHLSHLNGYDFPCTNYSKTDVLEYFEGDTVINSINYRIIREKYLGFYYGSCGNKVFYHTTYIREDTISNKVFLFKNGKDTLLYDYTLQVGDTIKGWHANPFSDNMVIQIDTIFLRNKFRRVWYFDVINNIGIVEGYGTIGRGVKASLFFFGVGPYTETRLTCLDDTLGPIVYQPLYFNTQCFPYSVNDINDSSQHFSFYPNPAQDVLHIETTLPNSTFVIYDITGKQMRQTELKGTIAQIDISSLPAGLYVCGIQHPEKTLHKKLIIQR